MWGRNNEVKVTVTLRQMILIAFRKRALSSRDKGPLIKVGVIMHAVLMVSVCVTDDQ